MEQAFDLYAASVDIADWAIRYVLDLRIVAHGRATEGLRHVPVGQHANSLAFVGESRATVVHHHAEKRSIEEERSIAIVASLRSVRISITLRQSARS